MQSIQQVKILGLTFTSASVQELAEIGRNGGLVVCPSAPSLLLLTDDTSYRRAMTQADLVIPDSGFMTLVWNLFWKPVRRVSGLAYLKQLLTFQEFREPGQSFWVMPDETGKCRNLLWLKTRGISVSNEDTFVSPQYPAGPIVDAELLSVLHHRRPRQIIIALGGGVQERLGWFLKGNLPWRPGIHCIGAAIAFLSGEQVCITRWADRLVLGWLFRCVSRPRAFIPRYFSAFRLLPLLFQHKQELPPVRERFGQAND